MFLPLGDSPNPPGTPYVNYLLIGLNVAIFLLVTLPLSRQSVNLSDPFLYQYLRDIGVSAQLPVDAIARHISAYDLVVYRYGYRPAAPALLNLFSAMFLHAGVMHLAGNMLFLWIFGDNVEYRLGRLGYLFTYLATGIASTLFFALFAPGSPVPMIGASGAISGVLGCYFLWFKRNQVKVFLFLFPFFIGTYYIPARFVLGFYLLIENLFPFLFNAGRGSGVAYGAHIGGFLAGLAIAAVVAAVPHREQERQSRKAPVVEPEPEPEQLTPAQAIAAYLRRGDYPGAVRHYFALEGRSGRLPLHSDTLLVLGEYLLTVQGWQPALSIFRRFLAERPADPEVARAFLGAGKAMLGLPRQTTSAYQYFLSAAETATSPDLVAEARQYLRRLEGGTS